ncbi:MAG: lytic transglycosylase domain-containing protein [Rickettsiales bacterium]|nr:lytic transglycosylase domain-containing protein [Rickettsiales bacterium]
MGKKILLYIFIALFSCSINVWANYSDILDPNDLACLKKVDSLLMRGKYTDALIASDHCEDEAIKLLTQWLIIQKEDYFSLASLLNYQKNVKNIPLPSKLQERFMNAARDQDANVTELSDFVIGNNAYELDLLQKYLELNRNDKSLTEAKQSELIINSWLNGKHDFTDLKAFLQYYKNQITEQDIIKKANQYLRSGDIKTASFLGSYIRDQDYKKYLKIVSSFKERSKASISLLSSLPPQYKNDETLIFYMAKYYHYKNQDSKVSKHILSLPDTLIEPERWYGIKIRNARYNIEKGNYKTAYKILQDHKLEPGTAQYAEIEWLAGWVALRFADRPKDAVTHFQNMHNNVGYTISLSRASYWLARSYKALDDTKKAGHWFKIASGYSTTYYGQMALMEDTQDLTISLPNLQPYEVSELQFRVNTSLALRLCLYLQYIGNERSAYRFAKYIIENNPKNSDLFLYLAAFKQTNDYAFITKVSRYATRKNVITTANYPIIEDIHFENKSLAFAIIKQESGFNEKAISNKGAIGFMQLMPATARDVSKRLKIKYSYNKLRNNQEYNIQLGSYYIKHLLSQFDDSYILAVASYNAGPSNVKKWIKRNGDIREYKDIYDIIDWVEKIPFPETRNYVQRILENMIIYLHILDKE